MNSSDLCGLVIAGGESSRMGRDKSLLSLQGLKLREQISRAVKSVTKKVFISLRDGQDTDGWDRDQILYDENRILGPAAALLAAHMRSPEAPWLAIACDFPFVNDESVQFLFRAYRHSEAPAVTCYRHEDGTPEPLFAFWNLEALKLLKCNVEMGLWGPMQTLKMCDIVLVTPLRNNWLINTNTPEEWARAEKILTSEQFIKGCP